MAPDDAAGCDTYEHEADDAEQKSAENEEERQEFVHAVTLGAAPANASPLGCKPPVRFLGR